MTRPKFAWILAAAALLTVTAQAQNIDQKILEQTQAYQRAAAITPSDSVDLPNVTKAIYVGTATAGQTIKIDLVSGGTVTLSNVVQGTFIRVAAKRVYATGTNATNLLAFF